MLKLNHAFMWCIALIALVVIESGSALLRGDV